MDNVTYSGNSAVSYGPDIASYPVKAILVSNSQDLLVIEDAPSGQEYDQSLQFALVDYDNQVQSSATGSMSINAVTPDANALGFSSTAIVNGIATFKGVIFQAKPGTQNVEYSISASTVDEGLVNKVFDHSIQDPIFVSFRFCKPGESDESNQCKFCSSGSYSLEWNSTECVF